MKKMISAVAGLLLLSTAASAETKIGVVDYRMLMDKAPQADAIQEKLKKEFQEREDRLKKRQADLKAQAEKATKDAPTMTESQRIDAGRNLEKLRNDLEFDGKKLQEDFQRRRGEELRELGGKLQQAVTAVATKEGYQLVLSRETAPFVAPELDITSKVLQALGTPGK